MSADGIQDDLDPQETQEWLEAFSSVIDKEGAVRAGFILGRLMEKATRYGVSLPSAITTPYRNTIHAKDEAPLPGDLFMDRRIRSLIRWNALAMVLRANKTGDDLGGHIASFQSSAMLYDIGFNYFWRAPSEKSEGDLLYVQGHVAPGIYARSFLEGRFSEEDMDRFRRDVDGKGLTSYPHPWLMPDYWQFPTVSMGLGPLQAIYQARFMRYLEHRGLASMGNRKVWAFLGDGECDEPESLGAINMAGREHLDNLIFVINCNLQRLDGPVRGNGKIIQELEGVFRGAGWNVLKVVWGRLWDPLLERDTSGMLRRRMDEAVDGEYQTYKSKPGGYTREKFFGKYPETAKLVEKMSDKDIWNLNRGGHDPHKVYAAYHAAVRHRGQPTVILAKTVKGYGMGESGEAMNISHQVKKMTVDSLKKFRDRFSIPLSDEELEKIPYYRPPESSPELVYMKDLRTRLGGFMPKRRSEFEALPIPDLSAFDAHLKGSGEREISTTMAFVRLLSTLLKDKQIGQRIVPIIPDEARTFGMEGLFRQLGIYSSVGQLYEPEDASQMMFYRESKEGQVLQEGINEAGAMSSWMAAATSYSSHNYAMIPFYIYYSMFGFQRIGDLAWAAGDMQARGFLLGGTSGRTTLNGEGLQHQDGHSHILAQTIPNCISYDPTYAYELAVIVQDGLRRMFRERESVFYYITTLNENYAHPGMPEGAEEGIRRGMYLLEEDEEGLEPRVQLLGCGAILREVREAAAILRGDFNVDVDVWSVTSFNLLARDGHDIARWNMLHPEQEPRASYVEQCLGDRNCPVIAATDYMKLYAEQIRAWVPHEYIVLGTDGFGRSDSRKKLREFFEVDRRYVVLAALKALHERGTIDAQTVSNAIGQFGIEADRPNPQYS